MTELIKSLICRTLRFLTIRRPTARSKNNFVGAKTRWRSSRDIAASLLHTRINITMVDFNMLVEPQTSISTILFMKFVYSSVCLSLKLFVSSLFSVLFPLIITLTTHIPDAFFA
ncbi:unnamed protein product [Chrysodeixis includens]|uniref:Uncharacterized protein n=1 Tax=Chrysodeixis includens TaxID=689277 RepID=A0A9N8Q0R8_CHRIL|nr:unnamed protein product [Chrysodeixis includens]